MKPQVVPHYVCNSEALANIRALLDALKQKEARTLLIDSVPPCADYSALELRLLAHTAPPRWLFEQAPDPRKKPKGPRNRWGGLK